jgi:sugar phosphate isomerase/epimerase
MYLTGIADEAAKDIDGQIKATLELGWKNIESRNIDGKNIIDIDDEQFELVCDKLEQAGVTINGFASAIANWGKHIDQLDKDTSIDETRRAIPRMQRLGTKLVRVMSYAVLSDREPDDQMEEERFARLREIVGMFNDAGLTPVHENCMNYGGMGWTYMLKLLDNVPGMKIVFDTGNPVFTLDRTIEKPYPMQSAWEFYTHVREHIAYVHIKDGQYDHEKQKQIFTFPGEGDGDVKRILADLMTTGYDGGISIEPHMVAVFHEEAGENEETAMYENYVEYGRRLMSMLEEIKA